MSPPRDKGNPRGSGYRRNDHDWYVEPPWAVADFLQAEQFAGGIWDPACGRGTIPIVAVRHGYLTAGTDLIDRGYCDGGTNFLALSRAPLPNVVCNPPFADIEDWIRHAVRLASGKVAIFCRLALLEGVGRASLFRATGLSRVWVCSGRVPCPPGQDAPPIDAWGRGTIKGGFIAYAWFVWDRGHVGDWRGGFLPLPNPHDPQPDLPALALPSSEPAA